MKSSCFFYLKNKKRLCKFKPVICNLCTLHYNILKKSNKLISFKISLYIFKNRFNFYKNVYHRKILKQFFIKYCFSEKFQCSICLDSIYKDKVTLNCGHTFHKNCLIHYITQNSSKKRCPYCRKNNIFVNAIFFRPTHFIVIRIPRLLQNWFDTNYLRCKSYYKNEITKYLYNNIEHEGIVFISPSHEYLFN